MVIFNTKQRLFADEIMTLDDVDTHLKEVATDIMGLSPLLIHEMKVELNDIMATYGKDQNADEVWARGVPDLNLFLQTGKDTALPVTHFVNPGDAEFTKNAYAIELPSGNFSVTYGVYADNEQDALDELADFEINHLKFNPNICIFKVDENDHTTDELLAREDAGEFSRLGNNSQLFDVSTISVKPATIIAIEKTLDIGEYLEEKKRLFKDAKPSGNSFSM
jgi:hypothetical protein